MLTNWKTISNSINRYKKLSIDLKKENTGFTKKEILKMNLQRDKSTGLGEQKVGAAINVINNSSQQINQNQAMILPPSPIEPGNSENALS